jgi:hypothetical protein
MVVLAMTKYLITFIFLNPLSGIAPKNVVKDHAVLEDSSIIVILANVTKMVNLKGWRHPNYLEIPIDGGGKPIR